MNEREIFDELDRMLFELPGIDVPAELPDRIIQAVHHRRKRRARFRLALSGALAVAGTWLTLPGMPSWLLEPSFPATGFLILQSGWDLVMQDMETLLVALMDFLPAIQNALLASLEITAWLGLAALGLSSLLALDQLIPWRRA